jgi:hypothetical protein
LSNDFKQKNFITQAPFDKNEQDSVMLDLKARIAA